ncbi:MAG: class I SAM-dependent methyltransferase [Candidatus Omnitrophota bacterium]
MEQVRNHYEIEKELANKLRCASKEERRYLYSSLYDELYLRVPLHPQLTKKSSSLKTTQVVNSQMKFLRRFFNKKNITFLEIGPGDCSLSIEAAKFAKQVYAVDVSNEIVKGLVCPSNFHLVLSDGTSVPVPQSVDVVYSNQLMEHLHPDDALEQLKNVYNALIPGGIYICITPNRLDGPHDISKHFDEVATGFHLKEYTISELSSLFRKIGFSKVKSYVGTQGIYINLPNFLFAWYETVLDKLPYRLRKAIVRILPFRLMLGIRLVGIK